MTLKASDRGAVVRLWPKFSFSVLALLFRLQNLSRLSTEKKQAILLICVGAQTYTLMRNLLSPDNPGAKSFEE